MKFFKKKEENPEDLMYQAVSFFERNQPKAAIKLFDKVIKDDPKNLNALHHKGLALNLFCAGDARPKVTGPV